MMKPTFRQFNNYVEAEEGLEEQALSEIFGLFKNAAKADAFKKQQEKLKAELALKKAQLKDKEWAAAKKAVEMPSAKKMQSGYGSARAGEFEFMNRD